MARRRGFSSIRADAERIGGRLVEGFQENRLLTHASEIAFQVVSSIVPLALLTIAVFGFLDLSEVWRRDLAPRIQEEVSPAGFAVIDSTIESVLGSRQMVWLTIGAALTCWEVSGAVRAIMGTLNDVDGVREQGPFRRRLLISGALAIALLVCMLGAVLSVMLVGRVVDASGVLGALLGVGRWVAAVLLLAVALTLLLRFGPTQPRPIRWVSAGSAVILALWIGSSLAFGAYASSVADYGSLFGNLASVFILLAYVYVSSVAFVLGVQLDKVVEVEVRGPGSSGKRRA